MDKSEVTKEENFVSVLENRLSDFFIKNEFSPNCHFSSRDGTQEVSVYDSPNLKLYFYYSRRGGEVNCLIGKPGADIDDIKGEGWSYLYSLIPGRSGLSIEELLAEVPNSSVGSEEQLLEIADILEKHVGIITRKVNQEK